MASVSIFFHSDPVKVEHYPNGSFIAIKCGEATISLGGEGELCAVHAEQLAAALVVAVADMRRDLAEKAKVA